MAYCVVNGVRYEAVANAQANIKGPEQLLKDITQNARLSVMPDVVLEEIVADLMWEKLEFANWNAVAKEIEIRRVGYEVETTLRGMYDVNRQKDETYQVNKVALAKREQQLFQAQENPETKLLDDQYKAAKNEVEADRVNNEASDQQILRWNPTTFPNYSYRYNQVMEWWLGLRQDEPKLANCWECALMALVNSKSLNVPKGYMIWCVEQIDTDVHADFDPKAPKKSKISRLYSEAVKNMDYYFPRHGVPVLDANRERNRPKDDKTSCFDLPYDFIIPRGRLLIFDYMAHVAISTGELRPITTEEGRHAWGRNMGHGVLDLNAVGQTIRERTIEDYARAGNCNNQLIVAPFPICKNQATISVKGKSPPTAEEIDSYRKNLSKEAAVAYEVKVKEIDATRQQAMTRGKLSQTQIDKNHKSALRNAKADFERAVLQAAKKIDKKVTQLGQVKPEPKEENFALEYKPFDPYNGKVTF